MGVSETGTPPKSNRLVQGLGTTTAVFGTVPQQHFELEKL